MTTAVSGRSSRMRPKQLSPSQDGIRTSGNTTLGRCFLANLYAALPSDASAMTRMSLFSNIAFRPIRTTSWSSAIKILSGIDRSHGFIGLSGIGIIGRHFDVYQAVAGAADISHRLLRCKKTADAA